MQKYFLITMLVLAFWSCNRTPKDSYELVWSDEFNYEGLPDTSKWSYDTIGNAWGWGNHELEFYTANRKYWRLFLVRRVQHASQV